MLEVDVESYGDGEVVVMVRGELDCATTVQLRDTITGLLNGGGLRVICLHLGGLDFIDSTGVGTLVVAKRICGQFGVHLKLAAVSAVAARVLGLTGVAQPLGLPPALAQVAADDPG
jgi:anti-anti-sigma factor